MLTPSMMIPRTDALVRETLDPIGQRLNTTAIRHRYVLSRPMPRNFADFFRFLFRARTRTLAYPCTRTYRDDWYASQRLSIGRAKKYQRWYQ